jgi:transcriptional regulator with XRE-family HTH domain
LTPELAEKAGVSVSTVKRAEEDVPNIKATNLAKIERALEDGGVIFIPDGTVSLTAGCGVRLREKREGWGVG